MSCPICGKETSDRYVPFCSKRCADVDLGRWLSGTYSIPGHSEDAGEEESGPAPDSLN